MEYAAVYGTAHPREAGSSQRDPAAGSLQRSLQLFHGVSAHKRIDLLKECILIAQDHMLQDFPCADRRLLWAQLPGACIDG